ncbi:MAG: sulfite exporter TauE/SafE family protein, partial [Burkholderiaceae bacterium]|nr:sulfite exporter TauE/SafE family protein [Burkholderiaceae bacterium]
LLGGLLPLQQIAFAATNLLLITIGLYLTGALGSLAFLERLGRAPWRALAPLATRLLGARSWFAALAAGMVWGWVPCGMVYGVLVAALMAGGALQGAMLMLAFGLGTLPNLLALGWSAHALGRWLGRRGVRVAAGVVVIGFGLAGFARIDPTRHLHGLVDACLSLF